MTHVMTGDYCCHGYANDTPAPSVAARYVTWAANPDDTTAGVYADVAAGMKTYLYVDFDRVYQGDIPGYGLITGADITATAKDCSGNAVTTTSPSGYLTDPRQSADLNLANQITSYGYDPEYNAVFFDDADAWYYSTNNAPCNWTEPAMAQAYGALMGQVTVNGVHPTAFVNALSLWLGTANWAAPLQTMSASNVIGGMMEGAYASEGNPSFYADSMWTQAENIQIQTEGMGKIFWAYSNYLTNVVQARLYAYASFMLAWDPSHAIYESIFGSGSLHVTPETGLTAYSPLVPQPTNISQLANGSVYVREYAACYNRGTAIGACAFIVNPSSTATYALPSLQQRYGHSLQLNGGLVLEGGTISQTGSIPTSLGPTTATILTQ